ncbi:MAG TPA: hypothetical protein VD837_07590, partial [Terriglobales bacterium]|nr:hypothetical protein [Terriglobales bacterium]
MQRKLVFLLLVLMTGFVVSAAAQQQSFNRYDLFVGYSHLSSPAVSLEQNGVNGSFGVNVNRWLALGADFSIFTGPGTIELADTKVAGLLAPHLPAGANPKVPFDAKTYTFAAGPQINIRRFEKVTFFVRPGLGILYEKAEPTISPALAPLAPLVPGLSANMTDTVPFYGF